MKSGFGVSSARRAGLAASACVLEATLVGLARASSASFVPGPGSPFAVASGPNSIATGDFNGDHNTDLVVPNEGTNTVSILLGSREGSFTPGETVATGELRNRSTSNVSVLLNTTAE